MRKLGHRELGSNSEQEFEHRYSAFREQRPAQKEFCFHCPLPQRGPAFMNIEVPVFSEESALMASLWVYSPMTYTVL